MNTKEYLEELGAFEEIVAGMGRHETLEAAWAACERGDWMLWVAGRLAGAPGSGSRRAVVAAAVECAELERPGGRVAEWLSAARAHAHGEATLADVHVARVVAGHTFGAIRGALDVAISASDMHTANAARWAAFGAASDHVGAAKAAILRQAADIVRRHFPAPPADPLA